MSKYLHLWLGGTNVVYPRSTHPDVVYFSKLVRQFINDSDMKIVVKDCMAYSFNMLPLAMQNCDVVLVNLRQLPKNQEHRVIYELGCAKALNKLIFAITDDLELKNQNSTIKCVKPVTVEDVDSFLESIQLLPKHLFFVRKP